MTITTTDRRLRVTDDLCHTDNSYQGNRLPRDWAGRTIRWTEGDYTIRCTTSGTSAWMVTEELLEQLEERFRAEGGPQEEGRTAEDMLTNPREGDALITNVGNVWIWRSEGSGTYAHPGWAFRSSHSMQVPGWANHERKDADYVREYDGGSYRLLTDAERRAHLGATAEPQGAPTPLSPGQEVVFVQEARHSSGSPAAYYDYRSGTSRVPQIGDTATVVRGLDGDGEVFVRMEREVGGPTNLYVTADCVRRIDGPDTGDIVEVARLTRELAQVKEQHERAMKELGVKAQLLGKETGMCGVLEKFAEEYGIPFDGIPFSGTITVTYKVEGTIDRDYAEAETIEEAIRVDEDGVHADLPENYSRSGHSDLHTVEVEDTEFDLTVGI